MDLELILQHHSASSISVFLHMHPQTWHEPYHYPHDPLIAQPQPSPSSSKLSQFLQLELHKDISTQEEFGKPNRTCSQHSPIHVTHRLYSIECPSSGFPIDPQGKTPQHDSRHGKRKHLDVPSCHECRGHTSGFQVATFLAMEIDSQARPKWAQEANFGRINACPSLQKKTTAVSCIVLEIDTEPKFWWSWSISTQRNAERTLACQQSCHWMSTMLQKNGLFSVCVVVVLKLCFMLFLNHNYWRNSGAVNGKACKHDSPQCRFQFHSTGFRCVAVWAQEVQLQQRELQLHWTHFWVTISHCKCS